MSELRLFADKYALTESNGIYCGVCEDMYVNLEPADGAVILSVYLNLPKSGAKRAGLIEDMLRKAERYGDVSVTAGGKSPYFLNIKMPDTPGAADRLTRYMLECDVLLRAYGRELGVLCDQCRSEIKDGLHNVIRDGAVLPICASCEEINASGGAQDSRLQVARLAGAKLKRRKGLPGGLLGCLAGALFWAVMVYLGVGSIFLPAIGVAFIVNAAYVRFGGGVNPKRLWVVGAFTTLAIVFGNVLGEIALAFANYSQFESGLIDMYDMSTGGVVTRAMGFGEFVRNFVFGKANMTNIIADSIVSALFGFLGAYIFAGNSGKRWRRR